MISRLVAAAQLQRHRLPLLFAGPLTAARETFAGVDPICLTLELPTPEGCVGVEQARKLIGQEISGAIIDTDSGVDPDTIGIVAGAVRAGGPVCFVVREPSSPPDSIYLQRFRQILRTDSRVMVVTPEPAAGITTSASSTAGLITGGEPATECQDHAITAVIKVVEGQRRRPTVLVADRGRGKSAALGIAAARLLARDPAPIYVTGYSRRSAEAVFRHAAMLAATPPEGLHWISPDQLLDQSVDCQLLLVDEAASLPVSVLERLIQQYPRMALATTVHGYEGSGRGFLLRFRKSLEHHTRGYRWITLREPVRWAANDPLERVINRLLVLDAEVPLLADGKHEVKASVQIETVDRQSLATDETLLREVFSLLVLSHYKTRPNDLQSMLDNTALTILLARQHDVVIGVALVVAEGGLAADLGNEIATGRRRPGGHVLPELLAITGLSSMVGLKALRIMRIVVHPHHRRSGVGSKLLNHVARLDGDFAGASFALSASLVRFWRRNGYQPLQIGRRQTKQGGSHSATLVRAMAGPAGKGLDAALTSLLANLPTRVGTTLSGLDAAIIRELAVDQPALMHAPDARVVAEVTDMVNAMRDPDSIAGSLTTATVHGTAMGWFTDPLPIIERILLHRDWKAVSGLPGNTGWRQGNQLLRDAFRIYLDHLQASGSNPE